MKCFDTRWTALGIALCIAPAAWATDITGVQYAAFDQPQIHALFRTTSTGDPILYGDSTNGYGYDVQAYLDTGTSGVLLSQETAQALGFNPSTYNSQTVTFSDIGIGGSEDFSVSDPYYTSLATFNVNNNVQFGNDPPPTTAYTQTFGPIRTQISNQPADDLFGPLDIFGMPVMQNKVVVFDPKPVNTLNSMSTYIYNPGTPYNAGAADTDPGIPLVDHHVQLTSASFERFTSVSPDGAPGPTLTNNPIIGPNPIHNIDPSVPAGSAPPVSISWNGQHAQGSFLFDSGAAESFISQDMATSLGIHYQPGTYNTDTPVLLDANNNPLPNQFVGNIGGVGGSLTAAGFYLDSLTLQTVEGDPLNYVGAPVLVADVSAEDPVTGDSITFDGDFGVNFWIASFGDTTASVSPFSWVTFDQPNGLLGFEFNPDAVPEPASVLLLALPLMFVRRRRS
jgi:hypothetical protein